MKRFNLRTVFFAVALALAGPQALAQTPEAPPPPADDTATVMRIQTELLRVGCYPGAVDGKWNTPLLRRSLALFGKTAKLDFELDVATPTLVDYLKLYDKRVCPLTCGEGERLKDGVCVARPAAAPARIVREPRVREPKVRKPVAARKPAPRVERKVAARKPAPRAPRATGGGGCFEYRGQRFC